MGRGPFSAGKRQREAEKARKKREKRERLRRNREARRGGGTPIATVEEVQTAAMQAPAVIPEDKPAEPRARRRPGGGRELFVGRLSFDTLEDELREFFAACGQVERAVIITDRDTGRSRGFGFVTMGDDEQAAKAIETLDGNELHGRTIIVRTAEKR